MKFIILLFLFYSPFIAFSEESEFDLDEEIYNTCEKSESSTSCQGLLSQKYMNDNYLNDYTNYAKMFDFGITFNLFKFETKVSEDRRTYYGDGNNDYYLTKYTYTRKIDCIFYAPYFEYRIDKLLYLGTKLGIVEREELYYDYSNRIGVGFQLYFRFNPAFASKYFTLGLSGGFTAYYINEEINGYNTLLNVYLGFKIANVIKLTIEAGVNEYLGFTLGFLL